MIDVNEKVMITLMFSFESRVGVSLATIIIISFQLNSSDGFDSYKDSEKIFKLSDNSVNFYMIAF